jgi:hypothetical protein
MSPTDLDTSLQKGQKTFRSPRSRISFLVPEETFSCPEFKEKPEPLAREPGDSLASLCGDQCIIINHKLFNPKLESTAKSQSGDFHN